MNMANNPSLGRRWEDYQPSKGIWFWSCAACITATIVIGFTWGGWVTGGTATKMAADAAAGASAQLAAADCIHRFENGPDASAQLTALKKAESYQRSDLLQKGGWATMPGSKDPVEGAALICAQQLVNPSLPAAKG
jgi:GH24 family phage-related lysozyme (muramidase)